VLFGATVSVEDGEFWVLEEALGDEARLLLPEPERTRLVPLDESRLITAEPERGVHGVLAFRRPVEGRAEYLYWGGRLTPRRD
jgi:hypothetical protein